MMANSVIVSDDEDEAESADYLVCVLASEPTPFPDNVFDFCAKCGAKVQHRPHAPRAPKRVCMACVMPEIEREALRGDLEIVATARTASEVREYVRKRSAS